MPLEALLTLPICLVFNFCITIAAGWMKAENNVDGDHIIICMHSHKFRSEAENNGDTYYKSVVFNCLSNQPTDTLLLDNIHGPQVL